MIGIQVDHRDPLEPGGIARDWIPYARLTLSNTVKQPEMIPVSPLR